MASSLTSILNDSQSTAQTMSSFLSFSLKFADAYWTAPLWCPVATLNLWLNGFLLVPLRLLHFCWWHHSFTHSRSLFIIILSSSFFFSQIQHWLFSSHVTFHPSIPNAIIVVWTMPIAMSYVSLISTDYNTTLHVIATRVVIFYPHWI